MEFREALTSLRGELGITQTDLARALHVSYATISRWELGAAYPNRSFSSSLLIFAQSHGASDACYQNLKNSIADAAKRKYQRTDANVDRTESSPLNQLVDDADFPICVCDLNTYDLLYLNKKAEEMLDASLDQLESKKCYQCIMHLEAPCPFCHKDKLVSDRFTTTYAFRLADNTFNRVQGKLIKWNRRNAQVRYIKDASSSIDLKTQNMREAAYRKQLRMRTQLAENVVAIAHYNLTHNTVLHVDCRQEEIAHMLENSTVDTILDVIGKNTFTKEERRKIEKIHNSEALIQQFYTGMTHINIRYSIASLTRYYECTFDLMQNPTTFDIEAFVALRDITCSVMAEDVVDTLLRVDYETIAVLEAKTGKPMRYTGSHLDEVIFEQSIAGNPVAGVEAYLRKHCADPDVDSVVKATNLAYVKDRLKKDSSYEVPYSLKQNGTEVYKRVVYAYLDKAQKFIVCAMQNLTDLYNRENSTKERSSDGCETSSV